MSIEWLQHPFIWGLVPGLVLAAYAGFRAVRARRALSRFRRHLSERLELEADALQTLRKDRQRLEAANEALRMKITALNQEPSRQAQREVEILLRAERRVVVSVPGFAGAWEEAKQAAEAELQAEESGRSMPRRVLARLLGRHPVEAGEQPSLGMAETSTTH